MDTRKGDTILSTKVCQDLTSTRNLRVSVFRSDTVDKHVLIVRPLAPRSWWRGRWHRLTHPKGRNDRARRAEALKDRRVGASSVVLPPVGVL
jgi:hypothetical protein